MMNIDQARAGGEGVVGVTKKPKKPTTPEMDEAPSIHQSEPQPLRVSVPEGWREV